jgi:hypothetical protein
MQNVTWVIDFRRRAPAAGAMLVNDPIKALELVRRRRRTSRKMFANTRALLAQARAVLDARAGGGAGAGQRVRTPLTASRDHAAGPR